MKNLNGHPTLEQNTENIQSQESGFNPSFQMSVYNEMSNQTAQKVDVLQMIQDQFSELNHLAQKRIFLLKEITHYLK